jgi:branched-chain amino acid transport system substrate-binding protein
MKKEGERTMGKKPLLWLGPTIILIVGLFVTACVQQAAPAQPQEQAPAESESMSGEPAAETVEVKIGIPLSLTGSVAFAGTKMQKAMELGVEQVNESGFLGSMEFVPIWEDDQSDQSQAIDVTRKLALQDEVAAIVGYTASNICQAALPVANELKVPTLEADCVAPDLEDIGPYIFRSVVPYNDFVVNMIDQLAEQMDLERGAIIYLEENPVFVAMRPDVEEAFKQNGIEVVAVESVPSGSDTDFSAQMTKIAATDPDVLAILVLGGQSGPAAVQARQAGMTDTIMIGEQNLNSNEYLRIAGPDAVGTFFPAHWSLKADHEMNVEYVEAYREKYDEDPDLFGTNGYAAIWAMAHAIKQAGTADREAIRDALDNLGTMPSVFGDGTLRLVDRAAVLDPTIMTIQEEGEISVWQP